MKGIWAGVGSGVNGLRAAILRCYLYDGLGR